MTTFTTLIRSAAAVAIAVAAQAASTAARAAGPHDCPFQHPATRGACTAVAGVDANTFRVQPPASVRWLALAEVDAGTAVAAVTASTPRVRANFAHPAVAVARMQAVGIDANHFLVQPPVQVSWTVMPQASQLAALPAAPVN